MTEIQWLSLYAKSVEVAALVMAGLFIIQYTWYSPWWRDAVGRTIVLMDAAVFLSVAPAVIESYFPLTVAEKVTAHWVNVSFIALIPVIFLWRIAVWRRMSHGPNFLERRRAGRNNRRG